MPNEPFEAPTRDPGVTWRAVLLALVLIPINVIWVTVIEVRWYALDGCELPLFVTPVFMLFVLVLLNLWVARLRPRWALSQGELLSTYVMLVISCTVAGHDMWQNFFGAVSHPFWFATPENGWEQKFFHYLPRWSAVRNPDLLKGFYEGNAELSVEVWKAWAVPLLAWGSLVMAMVAMMLCINVMIRRQWTEHERLTYPIVQLPLALTERQGRTLLREPMLWAGFSLAFALGLAAGINKLLPQIPYIAVKQTDLHLFFRGRPWDFVGTATMSWYPFMIGLAYFLPLDLAFSCWFFYLVRIAMQLIGGLMGGDTGRFFPHLPEQGAGGWLALALIAIWGSRDALREVWRQILRGQEDLEPMTYRTALLGLIAGFGYVVWFAGLYGVGTPVAVFFWVLFLLLSLAMTRVRAELGAPHEIYFVNPRRIIMTFVGTQGLSPQALTWLSVSYWFNRCYRCHPMPPQLEAFKMAEGDRMQLRRLVGVILLATALALVAANWANLQVCYASGAAAKCVGFKRWVGNESFNDLSRWLEIPDRPDSAGMVWLAGAFVFTTFANGMRRRFLWWPFHPAGYPLAVSFAMDYFWWAVMVAWFIKAFVLKAGGMKLYRKGIPFALGLILGDYTIGCIWAIIGPLYGVQTYKIFI